MTNERTLVVLKPDAVQRGVAGEILTRFERAGLKIVGLKMVTPSDEHLHKHYEEIGKMISRRGEDKFKMTIDYVKTGPVIAIVFEGIEAAELVRKMVGATEPKSANPGTIRGDYAHMSYAHGDKHKMGIPNLVHASSDADEAKLEIALWFEDSELYNYKVAHEAYTQPKK